MPRLRALALVPFAAALYTAACDTHAVGIDECRSIEEARCEAARGCDDGLDSDSKQADCERFSRDNCLHGLPLKDTPRASDVDSCVAAIRAAGACAATHGVDTSAEGCPGLKGTFTKPKLTACLVVESPEYSSECAFLISEPAQAAPPVDAGKD